MIVFRPSEEKNKKKIFSLFFFSIYCSLSTTGSIEEFDRIESFILP